MITCMYSMRNFTNVMSLMSSPLEATSVATRTGANPKTHQYKGDSNTSCCGSNEDSLSLPTHVCT